MRTKGALAKQVLSLSGKTNFNILTVDQRIERCVSREVVTSNRERAFSLARGRTVHAKLSDDPV